MKVEPGVLCQIRVPVDGLLAPYVNGRIVTATKLVRPLVWAIEPSVALRVPLPAGGWFVSSLDCCEEEFLVPIAGPDARDQVMAERLEEVPCQ